MLGRIRRGVRAGMRWVARDETVTSAGRSALVLAPHPDDETLGCGATILRKVAAGTPVTVALVTDGRNSHRSAHLTPDDLAVLRKAEMTEAAARLGLAPGSVRWGGFVDGTLSDREEELVSYLEGLLLELRPDEVYTTSAVEPHPDHSALGRAARRAVSTTYGAPRLLEYPVWLWGSWPLRRGDRLGSTFQAASTIARRRVVKVRAGAHLAGKLHALRAHSSQLSRPVGVPADEEWASLPPPLLDAAADRAELFLPWAAPAPAAAVRPAVCFPDAG
ncbi:PIG-L deacetylase family protein [Micromonospora sp. NPDC047548]|uniref:PIG-L deacetylase family protein n=1 Tax=Micromonospora sp. NPDC047548 TaxID=3155624 RepID=UPI00340ACF3E